MARIRTIKPEFFTSEDIVGLTPLTRLLYIATWCEADKAGRLVWRPRTMKLRYFPADKCDIDALARELVASGLVVPYGDGLAYIPNFAKHQHLNPRETPSSLPEPDASSRVTDAYLPVSDAQGGREGKGREGVDHASGTRKRSTGKTSIPADFGISESVRSWATEKGHHRLEDHLQSFRAKCAANGYKYVDWDAAFRNAISDNWARIPVATNGSGRRPEVTL